MKKFKSLKLIISILCIFVLCLPTIAADPGSADDPLISLSYLNDVIMPQIVSYVDTSVANAGNGSSIYDNTANGTYDIVNVWNGQTIIGDQSCHMILRMGSATIVSSQKGGVADVTSGTDLSHGSFVPANHLLIVPVGDGRGMKMHTDGIIMISGKFTVQ